MAEMTQTKPTLTSHGKIVRLTASGIMIALATVLSMITIVKMPLGGSLTPVSMLPICMIAIVYGTGWGLGTALAYALVQLIIDFSSALTWGLSVPALVACFVFDYLLAFSVLGFAGVFRSACSAAPLRSGWRYGIRRLDARGMEQSVDLCCGLQRHLHAAGNHPDRSCCVRSLQSAGDPESDG